MRPFSSSMEIIDAEEDGDEETDINCDMGSEDNDVSEGDEIEFMPVEHPVEPHDDDRPAKCPMPDSCPLTDEGELKESFEEILRKEAELLGETEESAAPRRSVKSDRKRHHSATGDPPKLLQYNIFQVFQQCKQY